MIFLSGNDVISIKLSFLYNLRNAWSYRSKCTFLHLVSVAYFNNILIFKKQNIFFQNVILQINIFFSKRKNTQYKFHLINLFLFLQQIPLSCHNRKQQSVKYTEQVNEKESEIIFYKKRWYFACLSVCNWGVIRFCKTRQ